MTDIFETDFKGKLQTFFYVKKYVLVVVYYILYRKKYNI